MIIPGYVINMLSNLIHVIKNVLLLLNIVSLKLLGLDTKPKHFGELKKLLHRMFHLKSVRLHGEITIGFCFV
jgi:hypothetical protein